MFFCYKVLLNRKQIRKEQTERKRQRRTGSGKKRRKIIRIHEAVNATSYFMADYFAGTVICFGILRYLLRN